MSKSNNVIPETIGIIMDGNRRYAKEKGFPISVGHFQGFQKLKEVLRWSSEKNIKHVIAYAFSTENWKRDPSEVDALMNLFRSAISELNNSFKKTVRRIHFIGDIKKFPKDLYQSMKDVEKKEGDKDGIELHLAVSYGGRSEIVEAIKNIKKSDLSKVDELYISKKLYTGKIPDPDLILRTGGEVRLSNFLLWQSAYSELFFINTLWPAFTKAEFASILDEYGRRKRNFGK